MTHTQIDVAPDGRSFGFTLEAAASEMPALIREAVKEIARRRRALGFDKPTPRRRTPKPKPSTIPIGAVWTRAFARDD